MKTEENKSAAAIVRALKEKREADAAAARAASAEAAKKHAEKRRAYWMPILQVLAEVAAEFPDHIAVRGLEGAGSSFGFDLLASNGERATCYHLRHSDPGGVWLETEGNAFGPNIHLRAENKEKFVAPLLQFIADRL